MSHTRCRFLAASWVAFLLAGPAGATAFTDQQREVRAASSSIGGLWDENSNPIFPDFDPATFTLTEFSEDIETAPDATPWNATVATTDPALLAVAPSGSASATQLSNISSALVFATGTYSHVGHSRLLTASELALANSFLNPPVPYNFGQLGDTESGESSFRIDFTLAEPTPYRLTGSVSLSALQLADGILPLTSGAASIVLSGGPLGLLEYVSIAQDPLFCSPAPCTAGDSIDVQGVLEPGSYTLAATVEGGAQGFCADLIGFTCHVSTSSGSFDLTLTLATQLPALSPGAVAGLAALIALVGATVVGRTSARRDEPERGRGA